jgi:WD40 repeat protein
MPSVFISYSRKDREFVHQLFAELEKDGRDAWVDWEDIPPTAEWMAEVFAGIEAAESFVFVISPESVRSEICARELAHAHTHRKRMVPIVCREVDIQLVPELLASRQWIFFRAGMDDFATAFQQLTGALNTDLNWVRAHTRLLVNALDWERSEKSVSLLLRGPRLAEAERWLSQIGDEQEPQPTQLQRQYVLAGRRAASRQQRTLLVLAGLVVAVTVALAVVAWMQRNDAVQAQTDAVRARDIAEERGHIAVARQLAAQAEQVRTGRADLLPHSVLLAAESLRRSASPEADQTLRRGLVLLGRQIGQLRVEGAVRSLQFASTGEHLLIETGSGGASVLLPSEGKQVFRVSPRGSGVFSPDGSYIAALHADNTTRVWNTHDGTEVLSFATEPATTPRFFSSDSRRLFASDGSSCCTVWDTDTWRSTTINSAPLGQRPRLSHDQRFIASIWSLSTLRLTDLARGGEHRDMKFDRTIERLAFSPDSRLLVAGELGGTVRLFRVEDDHEILRAQHGAKVTDLAFSTDGHYVATSSDDRTARIWSAADGTEVATLPHNGAVKALVFGGDHIATLSTDRTARIWDRRTGEEVTRIVHDTELSAIAFSPDARGLVTGSTDGSVAIWEFGRGREVARMWHAGTVWGLVVHPGGQQLLTVGSDRKPRLWSVPDGQELAQLSPAAGDRTASFSRDGRYAATNDDAAAYIWDTVENRFLARVPHLDTWTIGQRLPTAPKFAPDGSLITRDADRPPTRQWIIRTDLGSGQELERQETPVRSWALSPDGKSVATVGPNATSIWTIPGFQLAAEILLPEAHSAAAPALVRYSPQGRYLATAIPGGFMHITDTRRNAEAVPLQGAKPTATSSNVMDLAFSNDDQYLAAARGNTAHIWELATGRETGRLVHDDAVRTLAFSPDSRYLATASHDGDAVIVEATTGRELARMRQRWMVTSIAFTPDGRYLVTGSADQTARLWRWQPDDLLQEACERLVRNLTDDEWRTYLPDEQPRKTCPNLP